MILRRHNEDGLDEFCCEWCGTWARLELLETWLPFGLPERETCPACADAFEEEEHAEWLADEWNRTHREDVA